MESDALQSNPESSATSPTVLQSRSDPYGPQRAEDGARLGLSDSNPAGQRACMLAGTPYRFIAPLERGGMGEVIEAEHVRLGKRVVIKLLQRQFANRPDLVDRMRIEAQALARITHPNLVLVTDFGQTHDGQTYVVMERLYGHNLRQTLQERGVFAIHEAIGIVRQALAGLSAAHAAGVVHRDVKLENIFLCRPERGRGQMVKVLDFGIAKIVDCVNELTPAPLAFPTAEGVHVGTPRYFSPEQARGRPVDQRTDVYAAGIVLYTLIAGRGPFDHIHALYQVARAHALEPPEPPSRYACQCIDPALEALILKALAKRPDDRFPSAQAFSDALGRIAGHAAEVVTAAAPAAQWLSPSQTVRIPALAEQQEAGRRALAQQTGPAVLREPCPDKRLQARPPVRRPAGSLLFVVLVVASSIVSAAVAWLWLLRLD